MKKLPIFLKATAHVTAIVLMVMLPMTIQFLVYGSRHNGYLVYRYPHSTEIIYDATPLCNVTIVGTANCTPLYKIVQNYNPKGGGSYEKSPLSAKDYQDWNKAMN